MFNAPRLRRLQNDYENVKELHQRSNLVNIVNVKGDPPEGYLIEFRCRGVEKIDKRGNPTLLDRHMVELVLTAEYPRIRPLMRWNTPIFHPNFDNLGNICIKDWYPQQTLADLCEILVEMVQYKNYNTTSPLNMDAAMWAMERRNELPIDDRSLLTPITTVVTTDRIPIWFPPKQDPANAGLSPYCYQCGFKFQEQPTGICPKCSAQRVPL